MRRFLGSTALLVAVLASGCAQTHSVKGKVISGNLSFIAVVDQGDERLKGEGLPEAQIAVRADVGSVAGYLFGEAKSGETGDFILKFKEQNAFLKPVEFSAEKDGFQPAKGLMHIPPARRRLLIILTPQKPTGGGAAK
jgi:hypothetical protein